MSFVGTLGVIQDFIPRGRRNRPGVRINPTSITIHNTDNTAPGADARAHARFAKAGAGEGSYIRSWHFTVDDGAIYQHLPIDEMAYHAGSSANASSVSIEICMNRGINEPAASDLAARLAAALAKDLGLPLPGSLKQHHTWTGKNCPSVLRGKPDGWRDFVAIVERNASSLRAPREGNGAAAAGPRGRSGATAAASGGSRHEGYEIAASKRAKPIPGDNPIPFAASTSTTRYWPIVTQHPQALVVSAQLERGPDQGAPGRRFLAGRSGGRRHHVAVDLFAYDGDSVVAVEDGKIVAFYPFYATNAGEMSYALLIAHDGYTANYGEVKENSLRANGLSTNSAVRAGQQIGRVSSTNMLHFETYVPRTRQSSSWQVGAPRPPSLLNPTQLLLNLAETGIRLGGDGRAVAMEDAAPTAAQPARRGRTARTEAAPERAGPIEASSLPHPQSSDWHNRFGGQEWRYDHRGVYLREHQGGTVPLRWDRDLATMRRINDLMANHVLAMSSKHGINPALIMMTIATETHFQATRGFTGPGTFRWEPSPSNDDVRPPFNGTYSAGPMQCLATTVRELIARRSADFGLNYTPLTVAPALRSKPPRAPSQHPLYDYATNIDLGTAEIREHIRRSEHDPILVAAIFNAGSLRASHATAWGIHAHGDHLDRAAKWYGDACAFLAELGIF